MSNLIRRLSVGQKHDDNDKTLLTTQGTSSRYANAEDNHHPHHPDVLLAARMYSDAKQLASEGKWGHALHTLNGVLVLQRRSIGQDHPDAGTTLNDIGVALTNLERYFQAQTALEEARYIREGALEPGAPELAETLTNLAVLMDRVKEAEDKAHRRAEKREMVRLKSEGNLAALTFEGDVFDGFEIFHLNEESGGSHTGSDGGCRRYDVGGRNCQDDSGSGNDGCNVGFNGNGGDNDDQRHEEVGDEEESQILDEILAIEERREKIRLALVASMASKQKRLGCGRSTTNVSLQRRRKSFHRRGSSGTSSASVSPAAVAGGFTAPSSDGLRAENASMEEQDAQGRQLRRQSWGSRSVLPAAASVMAPLSEGMGASCASSWRRGGRKPIDKSNQFTVQLNDTRNRHDGAERLASLEHAKQQHHQKARSRRRESEPVSLSASADFLEAVKGGGGGGPLSSSVSKCMSLNAREWGVVIDAESLLPPTMSFSNKKMVSSGGISIAHLSGLNAMEATKALSAAARGEDTAAGRAVRRISCGSMSGMSLDAMSAFDFNDNHDDDDDDDDEEEEEEALRISWRRMSRGFLARPEIDGTRQDENKMNSRRRSLGDIFIDSSLSSVKLEPLVLQSNGTDGRRGKLKKNLSVGIFPDAHWADADVDADRAARTFKELSFANGPAVDLREQIRRQQEHQASRRKLGNGLLPIKNELLNSGSPRKARRSMCAN